MSVIQTIKQRAASAALFLFCARRLACLLDVLDCRLDRFQRTNRRVRRHRAARRDEQTARADFVKRGSNLLLYFRRGQVRRRRLINPAHHRFARTPAAFNERWRRRQV